MQLVTAVSVPRVLLEYDPQILGLFVYDPIQALKGVHGDAGTGADFSSAADNPGERDEYIQIHLTK